MTAARGDPHERFPGAPGEPEILVGATPEVAAQIAAERLVAAIDGGARPARPRRCRDDRRLHLAGALPGPARAAGSRSHRLEPPAHMVWRRSLRAASRSRLEPRGRGLGPAGRRRGRGAGTGAACHRGTCTRSRSTPRWPTGEGPAEAAAAYEAALRRCRPGRRSGAPGLRRDPGGDRARRPPALHLPGQRRVRRARLGGPHPGPDPRRSPTWPACPLRRARSTRPLPSFRWPSAPPRRPSWPASWPGPRDERRLPAQRARRAGATWILDAAAAGMLPRA